MTLPQDIADKLRRAVCFVSGHYGKKFDVEPNGVWWWTCERCGRQFRPALFGKPQVTKEPTHER